jgi:hypothetical protein
MSVWSLFGLVYGKKPNTIYTLSYDNQMMIAKVNNVKDNVTQQRT